MTKEEITHFLDSNSITRYGVRVDYNNDNFVVGFFEYFVDYDDLKEQNKWRFVSNRMAQDYQKTKSIEFSEIIDGDSIRKLSLVY